MTCLPRCCDPSSPRPELLFGYYLTDHARHRMRARGISEQALSAVLTYGRMAYVRGAEVYAIGRKEVCRYRKDGIDLASYDGVQVVCSPTGSILTVYRGKHLQGLRSGSSRRRSVLDSSTTPNTREAHGALSSTKVTNPIAPYVDRRKDDRR